MTHTPEQMQRAREYAARTVENDDFREIAPLYRAGSNDDWLVEAALAAIVEGDAREAALRAEVARLRAAGRALLREAEKSGMADNWTAVFDTGPRRNGTPMAQSVKDARRAMNEMRAALEASHD